MFFLGTFFSRIINDFKHKELIPLKLLFFVHSSTLYVLYPYLTIHMRELGINVEETAIMSAITPLVAIVMPPIAGLIGDRIGNFKIILSVLSGISGLAALLLLLVPIGRETIHFPKTTHVQLYNNQGSLEIESGDIYSCARFNNINDIIMRVESCGMTCFLPQTTYVDGTGQGDKNEDIINSKEFQIQFGPNNQTYHYTLDAGMFGVTQVNVSSYFFPMPDLFGLSCRILNSSHSSCSVMKRTDMSSKEMNSSTTIMPTDYPAAFDKYKQFYKLSSVRLKANGFADTFRNLTPSDFIEDFEEDYSHSLSLSVHGESLEMTDCQVKCLASLPRNKLCSNLKQVVEYDVSLTFWTYLTVRVFIGMISGTLFPMFEGAVIAILREHKADYGLQRIYATIGGMISSPLSGWLIDYASQQAGHADFRPAFYMYAGLKIVSALLMLTINLEFKAPATDVISDVLVVLRKIEIVALLVTCFILGTAWGYIESFLFWLLQDLGASRSLMGITITVGGIAGLPLLVMSGPIIDKIGHANVLFIGFIFYAIRLMGYSLIYNPWMCLIFEAMESVTSSLAFTAAVTYAAKLSTTATDASIQGLVGGLYYGVGKGAGSLFGGYLMKLVGTRPTYQIFAAVTLVTGIAYYLFNRFYIVKKTQDQKGESVEKGCSNGDITEMKKCELKPTCDDKENIPMRRDSNHINYKTNETTANSASSGRRKSNESHSGSRRSNGSNSSQNKASITEENGNVNKAYISDDNDK